MASKPPVGHWVSCGSWWGGQLGSDVDREDNPASRMERNLPQEAKKPDRVLSRDEVRIVWRATDSGFAFDSHARLMLLTGCRAGEWARARWS